MVECEAQSMVAKTDMECREQGTKGGAVGKVLCMRVVLSAGTEYRRRIPSGRAKGNW